MRGVFLSYVPASTEGGKRKLVARIEEHVSTRQSLNLHTNLTPMHCTIGCRLDHVTILER